MPLLQKTARGYELRPKMEGETKRAYQAKAALLQRCLQVMLDVNLVKVETQAAGGDLRKLSRSEGGREVPDWTHPELEAVLRKWAPHLREAAQAVRDATRSFEAVQEVLREVESTPGEITKRALGVDPLAVEAVAFVLGRQLRRPAVEFSDMLKAELTVGLAKSILDPEEALELARDTVIRRVLVG
jgi:hypothetical protein